MSDTDTRRSTRGIASKRDLRRLARWNDTSVDLAEGGRLHELVEAQVRRTPARVAVTFGERALTYGELDARADRIAARLRELDAAPDAPVGVCLQRSPELVASLLGVLKAGACYLPLDPDYPHARLGLMAEDAGVDLLLTHGPARDALPRTDATVVDVDEVWGDGEPDAPSPTTGPEDLAYLMYTSGSTGRPKGVMVEHRAIVNRLLWMQAHFQIGAHDVAVQKTPFSFDVSVWEFFWPLMTGARLEVAVPGGHRDAGYLARLVERAGVTVLHFVPSMLDLFLEVDGVGRLCRSLDHVICSGEALPRDLVNRFYERIDHGATLWNLYGPTEAAVDVTCWRCEPGPPDRSVPIGRPVANTRIHVVNEALEPVPVGEPGELLIAGVQVARGYWNRPDLTTEAFVSDPACDPGARAYRTGDRARWREDGVVEFLGRLDHQVKIRGQRVELGEVEAALRRRPEVRHAAAVVRDGPGGDRRLVGYVVPREGADPQEETLREELARELPDALVPARIVTLPELPLSPTGKLDRDALPEPALRAGSGASPEAPDDELEAYLVGIWSELLGGEPVGRDDRFFEIGASSLHAARFVNRLQEEIDAFVYVVTVFDAPTVAEYARFLRGHYPEAVEERFGEATGPRAGDGSGARAAPNRGDTGRRRAPARRGRADPERVDEADLERLLEVVPRVPLEGSAATDAQRNEPAIFVLAPPRSGTTLLRVMLAGHPELFAAAELQLLHFERLGQRRDAFRGRFSVWLEGVIRTLMELEGWSPDDARSWMAEREEEDLPVHTFYRHLQERLDGRTLVEKSPSYALDRHALDRAERDFREPRYIHLSRHPYAMVESFVSQHMEQVLFLRDHPFDARTLGELVWTGSHRTIERFLSGIPLERRVHLRFEDLVRRPEEEMRRLCERLALFFHPALLRPYDDLDEKMVDGVHDDSTPMGDQKLLERSGIDPSVAEKWRGVLEDDHLGEPTWRTAEALGYERLPDRAGEGGAVRDEETRGEGARRGLKRRRWRRRRSSSDPGEA